MKAMKHDKKPCMNRGGIIDEQGMSKPSKPSIGGFVKHLVGMKDHEQAQLATPIKRPEPQYASEQPDATTSATPNTQLAQQPPSAIDSMMKHKQDLREVSNYARGGIVKGIGSPTSDSVPVNLSTGEAVLPAKTVEALGGPEAVKALIARTNGKPPVEGVRAGGKYAAGVSPYTDEEQKAAAAYNAANPLPAAAQYLNRGDPVKDAATGIGNAASAVATATGDFFKRSADQARGFDNYSNEGNGRSLTPEAQKLVMAPTAAVPPAIPTDGPAPAAPQAPAVTAPAAANPASIGQQSSSQVNSATMNEAGAMGLKNIATQPGSGIITGTVAKEQKNAGGLGAPVGQKTMVGIGSPVGYDPVAEKTAADAARAQFERSYADVLPGVRAELAGNSPASQSIAAPQTPETLTPGSVGYALQQAARPSSLRAAEFALENAAAFPNRQIGSLRTPRAREQAASAENAKLAALGNIVAAGRGQENALAIGNLKAQSDTQTEAMKGAASRDVAGIQGSTSRDVAGTQAASAGNVASLRNIGDMEVAKLRVNSPENALKLASETKLATLRDQFAGLNDTTDPGGKKRREVGRQIDTYSGKHDGGDWNVQQVVAGVDPQTMQPIKSTIAVNKYETDPKTGAPVVRDLSSGQGNPQAGMPKPKSQQEMQALPKGTTYVAPDGSLRIKP